MEAIRCNKCGADNKSNSKYCSQCGYELEKTELNVTTLNNKDEIGVNSKNNLRNSIIGIVASGIVFFAVQHFLFKAPSIDKALMKAASELNKTCPVMIDQATRLDNALAMPDKSFQYNYTLINLDKNDVVIDTVKKYIEPSIINNIKTNPDLKWYRDNSVTMVYYYRDKDGDFVYKLSVTPKMYK